MLLRDTQQAPTTQNKWTRDDTLQLTQLKGVQNMRTKNMLGDVAGVSDLKALRLLNSQ